jgi:hypothetical protein
MPGIPDFRAVIEHIAGEIRDSEWRGGRSPADGHRDGYDWHGAILNE